MATTGDRIRELREERKWTQDKLAQVARMSKGFLSDIENNKGNISAEYALRIANALGVSLDYLLTGETGQKEVEKAPVHIPQELSELAQELDLTYADTLTVLSAHQSVIARRRMNAIHPPTKEEWRKLYEMIKSLYPDVEPKK